MPYNKETGEHYPYTDKGIEQYEKDKGKGMPMKNMTYWNAKNTSSAPTKFANQLLDSKVNDPMSNDVNNAEEGKGDNSGLIEALKKQDVAKQEVEKLKKGATGVNANTNI